MAKLNLQIDQAKIRRYIERRVRDYHKYVNDGPGDDHDPIVLITAGYYAAQTGYFSLIFDTRPDADSDGEWTLHLESGISSLDFPKWASTYKSILENEKVTVVLADGDVITVENNDIDLDEVIGEMIVGVLDRLRKEKAFKTLPLASEAFMLVEEFDGNFFWPKYSKRKELGRLK